VFKLVRRALLASAVVSVGMFGLAKQNATAAGGVGNLFVSSSLSDPPTLLIGRPYFFDVTVRNQAPTNPIVDGATLTTTMNSLLPITSITVTQNASNAAVDCSASSGLNMVCAMNNLGVDASVTIRLVGTVSMSASPTQMLDIDFKIVSPQEPGPKRSVITYPVDPAPTDLQVLVGSASTPVDGNAVLPVTVKNLSAIGTYAAIATKVEFSNVPTGLTFTPPAGCTGAAPTFECTTTGPIGANAQVVFSFGLAATSSAASALSAVTGSAIKNADTLNDPVLTNNTASGSIAIGPFATADAFATTFGVSANGNLRLNDLAASAARFAKASNPAHGNVTVNADGTFEYIPTAGYTGPDSFTYTVTDPSGMASTATVSMRVGPRAVDDTATTASGTAVAGTLTTNDAFVSGATWSGPTTLPAHGSVTINPNGSYSYTPQVGFSGTDLFTYLLTNPDGTTATAKMQVAVGPIAVNDTASIGFDQPYSGAVGSNDAYVPGATFTRGTGPSHGTLVFNPDGTYTYRATAGYSGPDSFTYTVTNPAGGSSTATVTLNVGARAADDQFETTAGKAVSGDLAANDRLAGGGTYSKLTNPSRGTVTVNSNGTFTYQPNAGFSGTDSFTYSILNADGTTATATVTIRVGPKASDQTVLTTGVLKGTANQSGTAADGANCSIATKPAHGTVIMNSDCTYIYTPDVGYSGQDSFVYNVTNPDGSTSSGTVTLNVRSPEQLPETGSDPRGPLTAGAAFFVVGLALLPLGRRRGARA
jgi:Bacterial Ig domain